MGEVDPAAEAELLAQQLGSRPTQLLGPDIRRVTDDQIERAVGQMSGCRQEIARTAVYFDAERGSPPGGFVDSLSIQVISREMNRDIRCARSDFPLHRQ